VKQGLNGLWACEVSHQEEEHSTRIREETASVDKKFIANNKKRFDKVESVSIVQNAELPTSFYSPSLGLCGPSLVASFRLGGAG
jgi:hypothetical protein